MLLLAIEFFQVFYQASWKPGHAADTSFVRSKPFAPGHVHYILFPGATVEKKLSPGEKGCGQILCNPFLALEGT